MLDCFAGTYFAFLPLLTPTTIAAARECAGQAGSGPENTVDEGLRLGLHLREVLRSWLDHRQVVLVRRSRHRLAAIERRLEDGGERTAVFLLADAAGALKTTGRSCG